MFLDSPNEGTSSFSLRIPLITMDPKTMRVENSEQSGELNVVIDMEPSSDQSESDGDTVSNSGAQNVVIDMEPSGDQSESSVDTEENENTLEDDNMPHTPRGVPMTPELSLPFTNEDIEAMLSALHGVSEAPPSPPVSFVSDEFGEDLSDILNMDLLQFLI
jgi:hypothetical protein